MPFTDRLKRTCGFLNFEEREGSNRYLRRYFIIDKLTGCLIYYMDSPSNLPEGASAVNHIPLHSKLIIKELPDRPDLCSCFEIRSEVRTNCFQADDAQDVHEWVTHLNNICKYYKSNSSPIPPPRHLGHQRNYSEGNINKENEGSYTVEIVGGIPIKIPFQSTSSRKPYSSELPMGAEAGILDISTRRSSGITRPFVLCIPTTPAHTSNTKSYAAHLNSIKKGFCVKQGAVRKSWKRRFFVLDISQLAYYKTDQESEPLKVINIVDIIWAKASSLSTNLLRDNLFEIITRCRTYYVQADSPDEMNDWVNEINTCAARCRPPSQCTTAEVCSTWF